MAAGAPSVIILAGPNGAGKSTFAPRLLRDRIEVGNFVNADVIAQGLAAFDPGAVAMTAGRLMLTRLRELAARRADFAFETTLSSRSFAPWLAGLRENGYRIEIDYLWIASPQLSRQRVVERVAGGGHDVPEADVLRRYHRGVRNFLTIYRPLAHSWQVFSTSCPGHAILIAEGRGLVEERIVERETWQAVLRSMDDGQPNE